MNENQQVATMAGRMPLMHGELLRERKLQWSPSLDKLPDKQPKIVFCGDASGNVGPITQVQSRYPKVFVLPEGAVKRDPCVFYRTRTRSIQQDAISYCKAKGLPYSVMDQPGSLTISESIMCALPGDILFRSTRGPFIQFKADTNLGSTWENIKCIESSTQEPPQKRIKGSGTPTQR